MPTLKALKSQRYGTRHLKAGDVFEARDQDARLLAAIGKATPHIEPETTSAPKRGRPTKEEVARRAAEVENLRLAALAEKAQNQPQVGWGQAAPE